MDDGQGRRAKTYDGACGVGHGRAIWDQALVTGEALGKISSQTLTNLRLIDNASDTLILRPLISHDKEYIISLAWRAR